MRHLSLRYVVDRLMVAAAIHRNPDWPWMARGVVRALDSLLRPTDALLEFGSGRSTHWFAARCRKVVSIEHNAQWHASVSSGLRDNVELRLESDPRAYYAAPRLSGPASFDIIVIDGAFDRGQCALAALPSIKPGGLLVVDDVHRYLPSTSRSPGAVPHHGLPANSAWHEFSELTADWRRLWFEDGVSDTALLFPRATQYPPLAHKESL